MPINYKEYPENWFTEIRPAILQRAGSKCEFCGAVNYSYVNRLTRKICLQDEDGATRIILTIAHLDHDKTNHAVTLDRLAALCQRCHLALDLPHHQQSRKYGRNWKEKQIKLDL